MLNRKRKINPDYLRSVVFGAEDSLVSTVGFLFGLASSGEYTSRLLILAGIVLIAVEALSMGVGAYLSETEVHELDTQKIHRDSTVIDGVLMFFSYLIFGSAVLLPYMALGMDVAKYISVLVTLAFLFLTGYLPTNKIKDGARMFIVAGFAILIGFLVANII